MKEGAAEAETLPASIVGILSIVGTSSPRRKRLPPGSDKIGKEYE
jgi:hypothetical protein